MTRGGKSGLRWGLVAGLPRPGTAPLDSCLRRNDARGGGQERWGEGVRFQPTRAREEVSRPSLIHVGVFQQGERRIWARTVTSWSSRTTLPPGHGGIPARLRLGRFDCPRDGPPGRGGPLVGIRSASRLRRPRRTSPRGSEPLGVRPLQSRLRSRCCRGTRNAQVRGQTHRWRTHQPQTLQSHR